MAWHELPLIFFTIFAQTSVGAFIIISLVLMMNQVEASQVSRINKGMFFIWVLMGIGFAASTLHLGSPLRAMNALNQVGSSWLSNEIFFGSLFFAAGGLSWILTLLDKGGVALRKGLVIAAMVLGLVFMYAMTKVYLIETVPTWNNSYTPLGFAVTAVVLGSLLAHTLLTGAGYQSVAMNKRLPMLGAVAVLVALLGVAGQLNELGVISSAVVSATELVPQISTLQMARIVLLVVALGLWLTPGLTGKNVGLPVLLLSGVLIFAAEFISRIVFYSLHMSVGL